MSHHIQTNRQAITQIEVTKASANWDYLTFSVIQLRGEQTFQRTAGDEELALVPLSGSGVVQTSSGEFPLQRSSVFEQLPSVLYLPPGEALTARAQGSFEFAVGGAPATGKYPLRLFRPEEMKMEVRGGGAALRQVHHILAHPLPAERLILYEVYVPGGAWSGYPPHCHDGYGGSAHLDETYYFRTDPANGFAMHRNYRRDSDFDETFAVGDGDLILVTQGFHATAAAPGTNVYFLNYLAGELQDEARQQPPFDDPAYAWLKQDYHAGRWQLPLMGAPS